MCKFSILVRLPFWGTNNLDLPLLASSSSCNDGLLGGQPVQLRLGPVSNNSRNVGTGGRCDVCKLGILVRLPLRRSNNLDLPLATSMAGNSSSSLSLVGKLGCLPVKKSLRV